MDSDDDDDDDIIVQDDIDDVDDHDELGTVPARGSSNINAEHSVYHGKEDRRDDNEEGDDDILADQWSFSYRTPAPKRRRRDVTRAVIQSDDVVELSSD
jgi:hypothetical protein